MVKTLHSHFRRHRLDPRLGAKLPQATQSATRCGGSNSTPMPTSRIPEVNEPLPSLSSETLSTKRSRWQPLHLCWDAAVSLCGGRHIFTLLTLLLSSSPNPQWLLTKVPWKKRLRPTYERLPASRLKLLKGDVSLTYQELRVETQNHWPGLARGQQWAGKDWTSCFSDLTRRFIHQSGTQGLPWGLSW